MDLGEYTPCLNVADINVSIAFYQALGFAMIEDHSDENWAVLKHNNMVLSLFQGHIENNLINFRGGDIHKIQQQAQANGLVFSTPAKEDDDGSWCAELEDPDGNMIFFNTFSEERKRYLENGRLLG